MKMEARHGVPWEDGGNPPHHWPCLLLPAAMHEYVGNNGGKTAGVVERCWKHTDVLPGRSNRMNHGTTHIDQAGRTTT
jgi:hypothetical protein